MDNAKLLSLARTVVIPFLDKIKGSGIVISNEDILRDALLSNLTVETDFPALFIRWAEQGRQRGVTFHILAAGVDQISLVDAFVDAHMSRVDAERFIANLHKEPAREIQRQFSARAES